MILDVLSVAHSFQLMAGLSEREQEQALPLCSAAAAEIQAKLRPGVRAEEHEAELTFAAAALAFFRYSAISAARDGGISFTAGDVHVSSRTQDGMKMAESVRNEAFAAVSPLLADSDFLFRTVV